jgi:hypothetical protein
LGVAFLQTESDQPGALCNVAQSRQREPHYAHAVSTKFEARGPIPVIEYLLIIFESDAHADEANMSWYLMIINIFCI